MKTFNVFAMAAATLVLSLSSCSREESATSGSESYNVALQFRNASTRADGPAAVSGTTVKIVDGYIFFVSANDAITKVYSISSSPTTGSNILNTDLSAMKLLEDVPGTSTQVYMVSNMGTAAHLPAPEVGTTRTVYMANVMKVEDQGEYTEVTSVGNAPLDPHPTEPDRRTATISLSTNVSRIQIKGITFEGDISGTVAGIFVNGYFPTMPLNGTSVAGTLVSSGSVESEYDENGTVAGKFPADLKTYVFDEVSTGFSAQTGVEDVVTPTTTNGVWGYNLFASPTPQVIIKLTDVLVDGTPLAKDQFITINGFKDTATDQPIINLAGGMIYTINTDKLVVKFENMSIIPGVTPIHVEVTVNPVRWEETEVTPNV